MSVTGHATSLIALPLLLACGGSEVTQVVLMADADARSAELIDALRVVVFDDANQVVRDETHSFAGSARIPLVPRGGDASRKYRVLFEGLGAAGTIVVRAEAQGRYRDGEKIERTVPLHSACLFTLCGPGLTCSGGTCEPACSSDDCVEDPLVNAVFVDNVRGADSNDCTAEQTPCATFEAAAGQLGSGTKHIYVIAANPYPTLLIDSDLSGTSSAPTVVQSWGDTKPVLRTTGTAKASLLVRNAEHINVSGFEVEGTVQHAMLIEGSNDLTITANIIAASNYAAPEGDASGILIDGQSATVRVAGNQISNQTTDPGNQVHGVAAVGQNLFIDGNDLSENASFGVIAYNEAGFHASFNRIADNNFDGIGLFVGNSSSGVFVSNNWICGNTHGISANQNIGVVEVVANTFFANDIHGVLIYDNGTRGEATVNNNLFVESGESGIRVNASSVRGSNNAFVGDDTVGNFVSDNPGSNVEIARPTFEDEQACDLRMTLPPIAGDGSRIGAK